jgi:hypothetical protein
MSAPKHGSWLSTSVIAVFITAHLLPSELYWATCIFYGQPYSPPGGAPPLVKTLLIVFFALELPAILILGRIIDNRITISAKRALAAAPFVDLGHFDDCCFLAGAAASRNCSPANRFLHA